MSAIPTEVITRFATNKAISTFQAETVFGDLEAFLLSVRRERSVPTKAVDEAWHEFILDTQRYARYCSETIGRFVHHLPGATLTSPSNSSARSYSDCSANCATDDGG